MRILLITQILPYPPDAGPRVKTWHVLRHLAGRGHAVTLASFVRPEEQRYLPALGGICAEVLALPIRRSRVADLGHWLRGLGSGRPFLVERDRSPAMQRAIHEAGRKGSFDIVHADQITMCQYWPFEDGRGPGPLRVFDAHNATWKILERSRPNVARWLRGPLALETGRLRRYEGAVVRGYDRTLAVTELDRQALLEAARDGGARRVDPDRVSVIPIAVDTDGSAPVTRRPGSCTILTLGTLHYAPNAEGIRWFLERVFPLVRAMMPEARLTIVGRNPPRDFVRQAEADPQSIRVTGYVEDLVPYWQEAAVAVVPVLSGSGMRVRILEGLSRGVPLVTTTVGLEGIEAQDNVHLLVEDDPAKFAAAVVRLLGDPLLQARLAANGRQLAVNRYDWRVVLRALDDLYESPRAALA